MAFRTGISSTAPPQGCSNRRGIADNLQHNFLWFAVPYKEAPSYNPRRRKSVLSMRHSISSNRLESSQSSHCLSTLSMSSGSSHSPSPSLIHPAVGGGVRVLPALPPPSPSPSDRWLELAPLSTSTASVRSDTGSSSSCTAESEDNASANGSSLTGTSALPLYAK